jgi:hypothetical protein
MATMSMMNSWYLRTVKTIAEAVQTPETYATVSTEATPAEQLSLLQDTLVQDFLVLVYCILSAQGQTCVDHF